MTMTTQQTDTPKAGATGAAAAPAPMLHVAPGPHFGTTGRSTRWMMLDVLIALTPVVAMSLYLFGGRAAVVMSLSIISCLATEIIFLLIRGRPVTVFDGSSAVTGLILALSMPWTSPWWLPVIGGLIAVAIGKMVFGGLGYNLFNPAMVGRAFLMICFTTEMTAWLAGGQAPLNVVDAATGATPMWAGKAERIAYALKDLFLGNVNGSLGETSALLLLLGGLYLCLRRTAAWQIPVGVLLGAMLVACLQVGFGGGEAAGLVWRVAAPLALVGGGALLMWGGSMWAACAGAALCLAGLGMGQWAANLNPEGPVLTPLHHLFGGALMFGAFFIASDPVSSPVSVRGRWVFGLGVGMMTMVIRLFSTYPEGVMFAVLLLNCVTPLINRWTIPVPVGGKGSPTPAPAAKA